MAAISPKLHPAITVNNIKNFIPIVLVMDNSQYGSWAELFKIHCRAFEVLNHIIPAANSSSTSETTQTNTNTTQTNTKSWARLDDIVLQWIYRTISHELLLAIMSPDQTANQAWERLKDIFQDNQHSRAVYLYLQQKFSNIRQFDFPNIDAYCQEIESVGDQLASVSVNKINDDHLVLQIITGLNEGYQSMATNLHHREKLPSFYQARPC
ncbi:uncharacterized protein [Rutidosis leptorrhynchoides]|uniref:uncharacterized protein n=1 Tax=Rutidosis leptorrhynchoides TaxID=125765 RepID=UPI003A9A29ED